jgi:hypothetical protein
MGFPAEATEVLREGEGGGKVGLAMHEVGVDQ